MEYIQNFIEFLRNHKELIINNAWDFTLFATYIVVFTWFIAWVAFRLTHRKQLQNFQDCEQLKQQNEELRKKVFSLSTDEQIIAYKRDLEEGCKPTPIRIRFARRKNRRKQNKG